MEAPEKVKPETHLPEQKRVESVKQKIKSYQQQKLAIKEALCNLDKKTNHKIIFEDSGLQNGSAGGDPTNTEKKGKSLFQSDDEEDESFNFDLKNQFDGEQGQHLFELQTKFKGDKRFIFDERFTENAEIHEDTTTQSDNSLEKEKQTEIEILEQVLGTKIKINKQKTNHHGLAEKKMLRFDPTQSGHLKYQQIVEKKHPKEKKIKIKPDEQDDDNKTEPQVSKDVFYKVTNDFKTSLEVQEGFSLRNLFNRETQDEDAEMQDVDNEETEEQAEVLKHGNKLYQEKNPFRYDSSDDEVEDVKEENVNKSESKEPVLKSFSEPFFFRDDDYRLQEGSDFVKRIASETNEAFGEQRRNLKNIIKAKVKNNNRKNNPFKKKLGGNKKRKVNRIKKALKR